MKEFDVIIIGAGAAGLMASGVAGKRGKRILLLEGSNKLGEKIRISGGGRCNFTNLYASPKSYLSENPHFCISPLTRYTQHDFIKLVESYGIEYHEKTLGQLFCDGPSSQIINMLAEECKQGGVTILLGCNVSRVTKSDKFIIATNKGDFVANSLIIATGGLSIPKLGATDFGYNIAKQFGLNVIAPRPALVPLIVAGSAFSDLSGISIPSSVGSGQVSFKENILFTHKGLSGPAILQISSYIKDPKVGAISIDLLPDVDLKSLLLKEKTSKVLLSNLLKNYLPKRFVDYAFDIPKRLVDYSPKELEEIASYIHNFKVAINGTEGYAKAEVTAGGVDTKELSSKTMEARKVPGLYFIGEVVDVTGWLGGYNFQWAWSSAIAAGGFV